MNDDSPDTAALRDEAEEKLRRAARLGAFREIAAGVTHDFNNLLLPIVLIAEMSREDAPTGDALQTNMGKILLAADRAKALLDRLHDLSRAADTCPRAIDIAGLVREVLATLRKTAPEGIEFHGELAAGVGPVLADADLLRTAIVEVVTNAVEAAAGRTADEIPGRVEVSLQPVTTEAGRFARLLVGDNGPGLSPDVEARAFDPFFTTRHDRAGRGLGLALADSVIDGAGGAIAIFGTSKSGTRVEILLPMVAEEDAA